MGSMIASCECYLCMCIICIGQTHANACHPNVNIIEFRTLWFLYIGPLTSRQIFRFSEEGLVNARFDYSYNNFRVTSMQAVINETPLPIDLYRYVDVSGRVEQFGKFSVIFYDLNQVGWVLTLKKSSCLNCNASSSLAFNRCGFDVVPGAVINLVSSHNRESDKSPIQSLFSTKQQTDKVSNWKNFKQ